MGLIKNRPYKAINALYWKGVNFERVNSKRAKFYFKLVDYLENLYHKK